MPIRSVLVEQLADSIKQVGLLEPVKRYNGVVIDGRHRELACRKAKVPVRYIDITLAPGAVPKGCDAKAEIFVAANVIRNHLTVGERALIAATHATLRKGSNQHTAAAACASRAQLARTFAISEDTIDRGKVLLESGRADLVEQVKNGGSLSQAVRVMEMERHTARAKSIAKGNALAKKTLDDLAAKKPNLGLIYADPPWRMGAEHPTQVGAPELHYPTMALADIQALPVSKIAAQDSVCCLWVPNFMLPEGLAVLNAWGFNRFISQAVWCKETNNATKGAIVPAHETLLVSARGLGLPAIANNVKRMWSWHIAKVVRHSEKPEHFASEFQRLYPTAGKLEMFARAERKGWLTWGNQVPAGGGKKRSRSKK